MQKEMKTLSFVLLGLLISTFLISIVSAAGFQDVKSFAGENIVTPLSNGLSNLIANEPVFIKSLFFLLVLIIVGSLVQVIPLFKGKKFLSLVFATIVSILAIWFIPKDLIQMMLNPYSAMGIAMISVIPFIMMVLFTRYMLTNTFLKKVAWLFFAVMLAVMMIYTALNPWEGSQSTWQSWVYGAVSVLAIIMLFFNQQIDDAIWTGKMESALSASEKRLQKRIALDRSKEEEFDATIGGA